MTDEADTDETLRAELLAALDREGIAYPPERLDEAVAEYRELKRLLAVVEAAVRPAAALAGPR